MADWGLKLAETSGDIYRTRVEKLFSKQRVIRMFETNTGQFLCRNFLFCLYEFMQCHKASDVIYIASFVSVIIGVIKLYFNNVCEIIIIVVRLELTESSAT